MKSIKFIALLLCMLLGSIALLTMFILKNEKLIIENKNLRDENTEFKWQLEQVPSLIEANLDSWCHGGYQ